MAYCDEGPFDYKRGYNELSKVNEYLRNQLRQEISCKEYDSWVWISMRDDAAPSRQEEK